MELNKKQKDFVIRALKKEYGVDACIGSGNTFECGKGTNTIWLF